MDWQKVWNLMSASFRQTFDEVVKEFPQIKGEISSMLPPPGLGTGAGRFQAYLSFMLGDPASADEDIVIELVCGKSETGFWKHTGQPWFPNARGRDAIGFQISSIRETLAELEPILLPPDENEEHYEKTVAEYCQQAISFLTSHVSTVIDYLRTAPPEGN